MQPFTFDQLPSRIVFAPGALSQVGAEVQRANTSVIADFLAIQILRGYYNPLPKS